MTRTVLYIEDHYHNRRLVQKILTSQGYEVLLAEDGVSGWEMVKTHRPRLLLLDIALPGEMDGLDVAAKIRADDDLRDTWIVALTASAMRGDRERFLASGCDVYLSKPIEVAELLATVNGYFDGQEAIE